MEHNSRHTHSSAVIHMPYRLSYTMMMLKCAILLDLMPKCTSLVYQNSPLQFYNYSDYCMCIYVGLFYYTLGNIHPRLRSGLQTIQLLTVVKTTHITTYGIDTILEPFMEDIKKLEKVCILHVYVCIHGITVISCNVITILG